MTTIKITPDQILTVAAQFGNSSKVIEQMINHLVKLIWSLEAAWDGTTREQFYSDFIRARKEMEEMESLLSSISFELNHIASKFIRADFMDPSNLNADSMLQQNVSSQQKHEGPPQKLSDGTPITPENKEGDETFAYWQKHIARDDYDIGDSPGLDYLKWLDETYGKSEGRKNMEAADAAVRGYSMSLGKNAVMNVVGAVEFASNLVWRPGETIQGVVDTAEFIYRNPEVLWKASQQAYNDFEQGSAEQKGKMLGSATAMLLPGLHLKNIAKLSKVKDVGKVIPNTSKLKLPPLSELFPFRQMTTSEGFKILQRVAPDETPRVHRSEGSRDGINEVTNHLDKLPEFTGSTRDKLLSAIQNEDLSKIVDQLYRPGATFGDGGTAAILKKEFSTGSSTHLIKAQERLNQLNNLAKSGKLGPNDLDILDALRNDLEDAIRLFK